MYLHTTRPPTLQKLSEVAGFTYSLRAPPSGTATTDTIEMVRNGSADMTGSWLTITAERSEYVSFTYPYHDLGIAFVYKPESDEGVRKGKREGWEGERSEGEGRGRVKQETCI